MISFSWNVWPFGGGIWPASAAASDATLTENVVSPPFHRNFGVRMKGE